MDTIPVSETLREWLMGHGMRSQTAGAVALLGMGKVPGPKPRQVGGVGENVNAHSGETDTDYSAHMGAAVTTMATRNGRIIRARPFLAIIDCEGMRAHG